MPPLRSEAVTPVPVEKDEERMAVKKFCYVSKRMSAPSGDQRATDQSVSGFPCLRKKRGKGVHKRRGAGGERHSIPKSISVKPLKPHLLLVRTI